MTKPLAYVTLIGMFGSMSKSQYVRGVQCVKSLWLFKHKKSVLSPIDASKQALFDQGHAVGKLAQTIYPNGKEIAYDTKPFSRKFSLTWDYINSGEHTIYEATFQANQMMCMVDILHKGRDGWELIEVKSSTSEKDSILQDLAVQYYIVTASGLPITKVKLMYINNQYMRQGKLDIQQLFVISDVTEKVLVLQDQVMKNERKFKEVIKENKEPEIEIGPHCDDPYECDCKAYCWQNIPKNSIFDLVGFKYEEKFKLYYQGVVKITDIPEDYDLGEKERLQIQGLKNNASQLKQSQLKRFLEDLYYPLCFFDFESFQSAIPPFRETKPFQQIPFQYSLHILNSPFDVISHQEYIEDKGKDPRETLIKKLLKDIPEHACILVYNAQFEQQIIKELARVFPQYGKDLMIRHDNMMDLMIPFKEKWVYTPEMEGRYSIKKVLPALVPELSYDGLDINNGQAAALSRNILVTTTDKHQKSAIRQNLLDYCKLDTYAMVKLLEKLKTISQEGLS
ncbi:DUF2779 domain-containing protein [Candidatus Marinamargulisbacteria bacterium SCGC AG-439-L15]|nr:DUF2779 domain-containing protein [Candidatus Marinamargulisbacteria bacterium SCGC AG-439-L15]